MREVARRYKFRGRHHVPGLPEPWCSVHEHTYTVEVVACGEGTMVLDTDRLDAAWRECRPGDDADLDAAYGPERTTVEALAAFYLAEMRIRCGQVCRVVVWEDDDRWGAAA